MLIMNEKKKFSVEFNYAGKLLSKVLVWNHLVN